MTSRPPVPRSGPRSRSTSTRLGRSALIGYLPVGYPTVDGSIEARPHDDRRTAPTSSSWACPYSDPVMDGPLIQRPSTQRWPAGTRVRRHDPRGRAGGRLRGAPVLVMTYWNLVLRYGVDAFARDLAAAGGAGLITPDLIPDEAADWIAASDAHGLDRVFLVAPSSTPERLGSTAAASRGFVYAASHHGRDGGARDRSARGAEQLVADTRAAGAEHVCVGLGVSTGEQAAEIAGYADGVIVGSALVRPLLDASDDAAGRDALARLTADLAEGVRSATRSAR